MRMPSAPQSLVQDKRSDSGQYVLLRSVPLFAALDDAAVEELCAYLHPVELKAGSSLFRVGDSGDAMYFIESGRVRITVTEADGREGILAPLGHGDFVGALAGRRRLGRSAGSAVTQ